MDQPDVPTGLEHRRVLRSIMSWGRLSEAAFALQGHPGLLSLVEAILGEAFTVFGGVHSELLIKTAHLGPSVAWHQDGQTHVAGNRGADLIETIRLERQSAELAEKNPLLRPDMKLFVPPHHTDECRGRCSILYSGAQQPLNDFHVDKEIPLQLTHALILHST